MKLCIPGYGAAEIQYDFAEGPKILGAKAQRAILNRHITPRQNSGKKDKSQSDIPLASEVWCPPAPSSTKPEERQIVLQVVAVDWIFFRYIYLVLFGSARPSSDNFA